MCGRTSESRDRIACAGCARKFLSEQDREKHYARNPSHAPARFDGKGNPPTEEWVELDREGVTVIVLPREDADEHELAVSYRPESRTVHVRGDGEQRFDVSHVPDVDERRFDWRFDGRYLELAFRR